MLRNFINIEGLISEEELANMSFENVIEKCDKEYIFIPYDKPEIENICEVFIDIELKSKKIMKYKRGSIVILDGIRNYKILCTEKLNKNKIVVLNLKSTFNVYFKVPCEGKEIRGIDVKVLDSYFSIVDSKTISNNMIMLLCIHCYGDKTFEDGNSYESTLMIPNEDLNVENLNKSNLQKNDEISVTDQEIALNKKLSNNKKILNKDFDDKHIDIDSEFL
ncbi:hypothetical protein ACFIJ5_05495 [Haloimpatiens sp. FM7330]|uniref:hypothetical protein n=1 Tax=Haloimpatiens sp. FM7330 TaxID=3298610 RepID=UPI0036371ECF